VEFVRQNPGLHLRELAARIDMPVSTLEYHCYQLAKHGHLTARDSAGFKAYYPGEGMDRRDKDILYLVRHEAPRRICSHLLLNPGSTPKEIKAMLQVSGPTLTFHLNKLRSAGILREEQAGRTKRIFVVDPERVAGVLVTYRQSFVDDAVDRFAEAWLSLAAPTLAVPAAQPPAPPSAPATEPAQGASLEPALTGPDAPVEAGPSAGGKEAEAKAKPEARQPPQ
jgi:DNA-binding transcriptional ArsR family regulator